MEVGVWQSPSPWQRLPGHKNRGPQRRRKQGKRPSIPFYRSDSDSCSHGWHWGGTRGRSSGLGSPGQLKPNAILCSDGEGEGEAARTRPGGAGLSPER